MKSDDEANNEQSVGGGGGGDQQGGGSGLNPHFGPKDSNSKLVRGRLVIRRKNAGSKDFQNLIDIKMIKGSYFAKNLINVLNNFNVLGGGPGGGGGGGGGDRHENNYAAVPNGGGGGDDVAHNRKQQEMAMTLDNCTTTSVHWQERLMGNGRKTQLQIGLLSNATYYRVYCTVRQAILNQQFLSEYDLSTGGSSGGGGGGGLSQLLGNTAVNGGGGSGGVVGAIEQQFGSLDNVFENELKYAQPYLKSIPKVVSLGFNVVFDIIQESYHQNQQICLRSLESLNALLQGLKPESFKYEPASMSEKFFELFQSIITLCHSVLERVGTTSIHSTSCSSSSSSYVKNFHVQALELSISSLITLNIARGDTSKLLNCVQTLVMQCEIANTLPTWHESQITDPLWNNNNDVDANNVFSLTVEIPELLVLFKKNVCSLLLGRLSIPEWCTVGFPMKSLCETFSINYCYQRNCQGKQVATENRCKVNCSTSIAFEGQHLLLYRCHRLYRIGSGYSDTVLGQEVYSALMDINKWTGPYSNNNHHHNHNSTKLTNKCCTTRGWVGCINGEIFLQPDSNWASNRILHLDAAKFSVKASVPLLAEYSGSCNSFVGPTLATTDGDSLILLTALQDDCLIVRELKPLKITFESKSSNCTKEKVSFSLSCELTIRLSTVCLLFSGASVHNLNLPFKSLVKNTPNQLISQETQSSRLVVHNCYSFAQRQLDTDNLLDHSSILCIVTGKDFALLLTEQGKVYYTGNGLSLGIRHVYSFGRWSLLSIPKPVRIVKIAVGHDGNHALLLSEDDTVFFVGTAKRGEDGESMPRPCHRLNKPSRVKKFSKIDSNFSAASIACNHGTSAIVSKSGELYLFGKDAHHTSSKGLINSIPNNLKVSSVALGKAHLLILTTDGVVVTSGFSNKGQCGLLLNSNLCTTTTNGSGKVNQQQSESLINFDEPIGDEQSSQTTEDQQQCPHGKSEAHLFVFGVVRRCSRCGLCTEFGVRCKNTPICNEIKFCQDGYSNYKPGAICGCSKGNTGCYFCGICTICAQETVLCKARKEDPNSCEKCITELGKKVIPNFAQTKFIIEASTHLNRFEVHRRLASKMLSSSNTATNMITDMESDFDASSNRIASVPPTILQLSTSTPIKQISAGLHHSVLLSQSGQVYTFGSNQYGQLGHGDFTNRHTPTRVRTELVSQGVITQIAAGANHTVLLTSLGEVLTFGSNQHGQLSRNYYDSCKLDYVWNTFPAKIDNIGPEYGRIATNIFTSGDFTFVKYEEQLLSSNLLTSSKLLVERSNLILMPPGRIPINGNNFDKLFEEKSCKHLHCRGGGGGESCGVSSLTGGDYPTTATVAATTTTTAAQFNNLHTNMLIISRNSGTCSILEWDNLIKTNKYAHLFDSKHRLNFDLYSAVFVDKFYNNLWTYNSYRDEFARFNLIELEAANRMNKLCHERQQQQSMNNGDLQLVDSLTGLYHLNMFGQSGSQFMRLVPAVLQPDITVPMTDYCGLRQTPQQIALELLAFLSTLTYSHLLCFTVNEKSNQTINYLTNSNLQPEEYMSICRFDDFGGGWGYPPRSVEAIRFTVDADIILGGVGLYGGRGDYSAQLKLFDIGFDGSEIERDGEQLAETDVLHYECLPRHKYQILFDVPVYVHANRWYVLWASISGPSSDCGSNGQSFICTTDNVMFHFKPSKLSNNGTDVNSGQLPVLYFKPIKSTDIPFKTSNATNCMLLSLDEEGLPFHISKDFALKINSGCVYSLCELMSYVWSRLQALFQIDRLKDLFTCKDEDQLVDRLDRLSLEIKKQVYMANFVLELARAYVQILLPINDITLALSSTQHRKSTINCMQQSYNNAGGGVITKSGSNYDFDEYQQLAHAFYALSNQLSSILTQPIEINELVMEQINLQDHRLATKRKLFSLIRFNAHFIDQCHLTFRTCSYAFFPSNTLKWSALCDLISKGDEEGGRGGGVAHLDDHVSSSSSSGRLFSNKQLYLLSALLHAFSAPTLKLVNFFPTLKGSITESYEDYSANINETLSPISDMYDLTYHIISKRASELYKYEEQYLGQDYTSLFVFDALLDILIKPIKMALNEFKFASKVTNRTEMSNDNTTAGCSNEYRQLGNYSDSGSSCGGGEPAFFDTGTQIPICNHSSPSSSSSSSSPSTSSSSASASLFSKCSPSSLPNGYGLEYNNIHMRPDIELQDDYKNFLSAANSDTYQENFWLEHSFKSRFHLIDSKKCYANRLITGANNLLIKLISELNACAAGLLSNNNNNLSGGGIGVGCGGSGGESGQTMFNFNTEYVTPSRFYRRSSSKSWDTGAGAPEAISFSVNKPGIYISGVRVYSFSMTQVRYQLKLLEKTLEEESPTQSVYRFHKLALVSGILSGEEVGAQNDLCEIRFERPVLIQPDAKYELVFKNYSISSYSGDMGAPQVCGDDGTVFTFMDSSLSKNGTNLNRGQIPHILYYNIPPGCGYLGEKNSNTWYINSHMISHSVMSLFRRSVEQAKILLQSANELLVAEEEYLGPVMMESSTGLLHTPYNNNNNKHSSSVVAFVAGDDIVPILDLLITIFESTFFRQFMPTFTLHLHSILSHVSFAHEIITLLHSLIPLVAQLNKTITSQCSSGYSGCCLTNNTNDNHNPSQSPPSTITTSPHYILIESDHPYKPATVTTYLARFPSSVKWISIEFDAKSSTAQEEDYLEILIPNECNKIYNSNSTTATNGCLEINLKKDSINTSGAFRNLTRVYKRFSGPKFAENLTTLDFIDQQRSNPWHSCWHQPNSTSSRCLYVPGNELVFMLQTSSDYVHSSHNDLYYGFKAQVIGYESPFNFVRYSSIHSSETKLSEMSKDSMLIYLKEMMHNFENDLVYLFGRCVTTLVNASAKDTVLDLVSNNQVSSSSASSESNHNNSAAAAIQQSTWALQFDPLCDIEYTQQIFHENSFILNKSINLNKPLNMQMVKRWQLPVANVHPFMEDFIQLTPHSSGTRLALWFQNESFISPSYSLINIVQSIDFCCRACAQVLENLFHNNRTLCARCHYQLFVKTIPQQSECTSVPVGKKFFIKMVTRDQHREIAFDRNASVTINLRPLSPFSEENLFNHYYGQSPDLVESQKNTQNDRSPLLNLALQNPYQITVHDKCRYHSITMMAAFEQYSLEELRYATQASLKRKTMVDSVPVKSFDNGYYLASWTPLITGVYKIELFIDGEPSEDAFMINVTDLVRDNSLQFCSVVKDNLIPYNDESELLNCATIHSFDQKMNLETVPMLNSEISPVKCRSIKHSIRKFICNDSAGLRIRALPSLQSEQIGIVAVNGLLTIIDQLENGDGIWVRLSNESIQAYCSNFSDSYLQHHQTANKKLFLPDNFEANTLTDMYMQQQQQPPSTPVKSSTSSVRTEAWTLQFNRHFNRTLLVPIDAEEDIQHDQLFDLINRQVKLESLTIPGWLQVVNCAQDGHLIRNSPTLTECSVILGIVPLNAIVHGVEVIQNEFGLWIRLSQDSLSSHVGNLNKSTYFETDIDGWMLAQNVNGLIYMRGMQEEREHDYHQLSYGGGSVGGGGGGGCDTSPSKYNLLELDENDCYSVPAKQAISNRAAQCIRAIFAAFVWHEGILNDVLTAASYLKFNAEVTKDYVKYLNEEEEERKKVTTVSGEKRRRMPNNNSDFDQNKKQINNKKVTRSQKALFRHSVEVSQLLSSCWTSDVNSNELAHLTMLETNNNLNNFNNNNNNNNNNNEDNNEEPNICHNHQQQQSSEDSANDKIDSTVGKNDFVHIPEILINLLKIWDFVFSECLQIFTNYTDTNRPMVETLPEPEPSSIQSPKMSFASTFYCDYCENCGKRIANLDTPANQQQFAMLCFDEEPMMISMMCLCNADKQRPICRSGMHHHLVDDQANCDDSKKNSLINSATARKHIRTTNSQQLYDSLKKSAYYLLSLVPSNNVDSLLTTTTNTEEQQPNGENSLTKLMLDQFMVNDDGDGSCFQSLSHLGIHRSFYQQRLAEEKLSNMAILSIQHQCATTTNGYHQKPPLYSSPTAAMFGEQQFNNLNPLYGETLQQQQQESSLNHHNHNLVEHQHINEQNLPIEQRKSFKFYRSISVGMNETVSSSSKSTNVVSNERMQKNSYRQYIQHFTSSKHHNKSTEYLDADSQMDKFNMPFLCKPSPRLVNLVQECIPSSSSCSNHKELSSSSSLVQDKLELAEMEIIGNNKTNPTVHHSVLFRREVFRFIFSHYNIDLYDTVMRGSLCAAAYRALGLNALNWLLTNVSNLVSLHDTMWIFVHSLISKKTTLQQSSAKKGPIEEKHSKRRSAMDDSINNSINSGQLEVCQHPFSGLELAGESASSWVSEALHRWIKSISNLLPLLPPGSPLQQMAVRCLGIDFQPNDHIFLHECKLFSHISAILSRSLMDSFEPVPAVSPSATAAGAAVGTVAATSSYGKLDSEQEEKCSLYSIYKLSTDITVNFQLKASSRQSMITSLTDNSTETFWESGNEDRNKNKSISLIKSEEGKFPMNSCIKFVCVYIDNTRDVEYKVSQVSVKIMMEKSDALKYCHELLTANSLYAGGNEIEFENVQTIELDSKFCGWFHCELTPAQSEHILRSFKYIKLEFNSQQQNLRVRQIKVLSISNCFEQILSNEFAIGNFSGAVDDECGSSVHQRKLISSTTTLQLQGASCEAETVQVFRLLTSQVFGKLLSSEGLENYPSPSNANEQQQQHKRTSSSMYPSGTHNNSASLNNGNDLREHMVGILFSHGSKLTELQKQLCSHIVQQIHYESTKVLEDWKICQHDERQFATTQLLDEFNTAPIQSISVHSMRDSSSHHEAAVAGNIPNDAYCFELLSLVLALSGSTIGQRYLSKQNELCFDILTLLHTSSDRVKRQVLSLIRRVISCIKPTIFAQMFDVPELPSLNEIVNKTQQSFISTTNEQEAAASINNNTTNASSEPPIHCGVLDIFLACIAKSITLQVKIKGSNSDARMQVRYSMKDIFNKKTNIASQQWWLRGSISQQIAQSIVVLLKDMVAGTFGDEWSTVARNALVEKILNLSQLPESVRTPDRCAHTASLWLALASLCVIDQKDAETLSVNNLYKLHDQANGNSTQVYCDNHDDGETMAIIQCNQCGNLCIDCDRFLHLNTRTRTHRRHIFKKEIDSIKVDIHEGCGRAKFLWVLVVADSKLLKALAEFRVGHLKSTTTNAIGGGTSSMMSAAADNTGQCRFCGSHELTVSLAVGEVCNSVDCLRFASETCTKVLSCGHHCGGIRNEQDCLPCLHGCSSGLRQDGDDMCMVCFSESLFAAPCIQLACKHIFHSHCIRTVLEKRWSGGRISFAFAQCPICKESIEHVSLASLLQPIKLLFEDVRRKALMRLEYENQIHSEAITTAGGRFYNDAAGFAMEKYSYYLCFKCKKAYFGGDARCDAEFDGNSDHFNPEELICGSCSDVAEAQICPKHGTDFLEYKCRFCCSVAVYFCFGSTHFCNPCHEDFQRLVALKEYPKCPVGPRCVALDLDECPLHLLHPPTGIEFALGCGICRNAHTF